MGYCVTQSNYGVEVAYTGADPRLLERGVHFEGVASAEGAMLPIGVWAASPRKILKINSLDAISWHLTTRSSIYKNARRREMIRGQFCWGVGEK
jgi:hypothetical protein